MAIGDRDDIASRLARLIPYSWFPSGAATIRDAILQGAASALAFAYSLLAYVRLQTRILTATGGWLDLIAGDFFGASIVRAQNQTDASFRAAIIANLFRERATRNAIQLVLVALTGRAPRIVEPQRPADTGAYSAPNSGYGVAGAYGSMLLPYQAFVTAFRPLSSGIPYVVGYGCAPSGYSVASRGEYASLDMVIGAVQDADIYAAISAVAPAGTEIWTQISS